MSAIVPEATSPDADERRLLRLILYDALGSEAMGTLTTGVFLVGFAVALGAGNFAIGVLAAVPFCVQLLQIPAVLFGGTLARAPRHLPLEHRCRPSVLLGAAAAPLLGQPFAIIALIVSLAIYQAMAAIAGCAWNSWMRDLVPSSQFGRFFARRTTATTALSVTVALLGGALVDSWKRYVPDQTVFGYSKFEPIVIASRPDSSNIIVPIDGRAKSCMPFGHKAPRSCLRDTICSWIPGRQEQLSAPEGCSGIARRNVFAHRRR